MANPRRPQQRWRFYRTSTGNRVVDDELDALGHAPAAALVDAMKRRAKGRHRQREDEQVRGRIRAVRITFDGSEYRALYASVAPHSEILLAVTVFGKKTRKTPANLIELAERRLRDWEERGEKTRKGS